MRQVIYRAMHQSDDLVVTFDYCDARGILTHRVVSPIRFLGQDRFLASVSAAKSHASSTWTAVGTYDWRRQRTS